MRKRYTVKRGKRSSLEYDVLVYDQGTLVFTGRFGAAGKRRLTDSELRIIAAIQFAVEELT